MHNVRSVFKGFYFLSLMLTPLFFFWGCGTGARTVLLPGSYEGYTLLPNGAKLTPAGTQIEIGELPMNMIIIEKGKYAVTSNSGMGQNSLSLIDIRDKKEIQRVVVHDTWRGIAFDENRKVLYVSGGNDNKILLYTFSGGKLSLQDSIIISKPWPDEKTGIAGLSYCESTRMLFAATRYAESPLMIDAVTKTVKSKINLHGQCFEAAALKDGSRVFVSLWGGSAVAEIDPATSQVVRTIKTGEHPCELLLSRDEKLLFVPNANRNTVSVIDVVRGAEVERLNSALSPELPPGSTPDAVCYDDENGILYAANADNNYLAVFKIEAGGKSHSLGFIPSGWYPTSVRYDAETKTLIAANGKGSSSFANPAGPNPYGKDESKYDEYIGRMLKGTVSFIPKPDEDKMKEYSKRVYENTPREKETAREQHVIPVKHNGIPSEKIKYVFYIIKENRTYDQVYGDMKEGNGDASLCIFPDSVTPNQHKLAREFALFDNFYADAEVSADGHNWSTAAYATDYVEKLWPAMYGRRGGSYDFEGGVPVSSPASGYIWTQLAKKGIAFRNYGEFTEKKEVNGTVLYEGKEEELKKTTCAEYPGFDLKISDMLRFDIWKKDFTELDRSGSMPNFSLIRLPNDHTVGTRKNSLTPSAYVAQNDYALGKIVETIALSRYWKESLILVVEDDAQNGADHVDAHRSCMLAVSPYIRKHGADHTMYSTSSVLKTIELTLGLPPMTQHDLAAEPVVNCISDMPEITVYQAIEPKIDITAKNASSAFGSERCELFNLEKEDAIPDVEFSEIIWKSVRGEKSTMPAPVRSAFVNYGAREEDDE